MKKILITGANSYIGTSFEKYVDKYNEFCVETLDLLDKSWECFDFSNFDVVFHVAGIAHINENKDNSELYYRVNRDLAIKVAYIAKKNGVSHFVFMSSMSVYGILEGFVDESTVPMPKSNYGKSKYEAEKSILKMADNNFTVSVIRPPMVYGSGCKGNYQKLRKFALKSPFFLISNNKRSMIFIDNLCEFIYQVVDRNIGGIFLPQNIEYISTDNMIKQISKIHNHKIIFIPFFEKIIKKIKIGFLQKIFGNLAYRYVDYGFDYNVVFKFSETILKSECVYKENGQ